MQGITRICKQLNIQEMFELKVAHCKYGSIVGGKGEGEKTCCLIVASAASTAFMT